MSHSSPSTPLPTGLQGVWRDFLVAVMFLTRLPVVTQPQLSPEHIQRSVRCFPLVGLVVGGVGAIALTLAHAAGLSLGSAAAVGVVTMIGISGGLHHDGLADVADGFGGGQTREQKLEIMRDSRIGSYGVLALVGAFALQMSALSDMESVGAASVAMIGASVFSRFAMVVLLYIMPSVRAQGLGASLSGVTAKMLRQSGIWTGVILLVLLPLGPIVSMMIFAGGALAVFMGIAYLQVKGQTGDICGASQQVTECIALLTLASFL